MRDIERTQVSEIWQSQSNGEDIDIHDGTDQNRLIIRVFGYAGTVIDRDRDKVAHLIAAAPDLLVACERALSWLEDTIERDLVLAAIAKAKRGQS